MPPATDSPDPWKPPILHTPRLVLRPVGPDDAPAVFAYASNPNVTPHTLWDTHRTIDDSMAFVRDYTEAHYREHEPDPLGITLRDDPSGTVVGAVGCHWASRPNRTMELGFVLAEPLWGRGLTTEASRALIGHAFTAYPVERLQARCMVENAASRRVLEKLGMAFEGTLRSAVLLRGRFRDLHIFSVLRGEWEATGTFCRPVTDPNPEPHS